MAAGAEPAGTGGESRRSERAVPRDRAVIAVTRRPGGVLKHPCAGRSGFAPAPVSSVVASAPEAAAVPPGAPALQRSRSAGSIGTGSGCPGSSPKSVIGRNNFSVF